MSHIICFVSFPSRNSALVKEWTIRMHRLDFTPSKSSVVCSDHFEEACFDRTGQTVRLRDDAVPTIFNLPPHLKSTLRHRKPPTQRTPSTSTITSPVTASGDVIEAHGAGGTSSESNVPSTSVRSNVMHMDHTFAVQEVQEH